MDFALAAGCQPWWSCSTGDVKSTAFCLRSSVMENLLFRSQSAPGDRRIEGGAHPLDVVGAVAEEFRPGRR